MPNRWALYEYANQTALLNILIEEHFDDEYVVAYSLSDLVKLIDFLSLFPVDYLSEQRANLVAWLLTLRDSPEACALTYKQIIEPIKGNLPLDEYRFLFHVRYEDISLFANCELVSKDYLPFRLKVGK